MLARGSEMVSELSLDLFSQTNSVTWIQPYLGFDWFGTILGAFLTTEFVHESSNIRIMRNLNARLGQ